MADGTVVSLFTIEHQNGLRVGLTDFGGAITSLAAPDREGAYRDVVLGYDTLDGYIGGKSFFGATVGRYANRIAAGQFMLDGVEYRLPLNDGPNHLHGGPNGFNRVIWTAEAVAGAEGPAVRLSRTSPDGEEGYPGNLRVEVTFTLVGAETLRIEYFAETDKATPVNLTNHSFFNLAGHDSGPILEHEATIFANEFVPIDAGYIPIGELRAVAETPFDFRQPRAIGARIESGDQQLQFAGGYDHTLVLGVGGTLRPAVRLREPRSGRVLEVATTETGVQLYSGNFLDGTEIGKGGCVYQHRCGLCLETQHFPDSPNRPNFPATILRPGAVFRSTTEYRFYAEEQGAPLRESGVRNTSFSPV